MEKGLPPVPKGTWGSQTDGGREDGWDPGHSLAPKGHLVISLEEPQVTLDEAGRKVIFLLDTGATYSVLTDFPGPLFSQSCIITGIDGWPKAK